jgi:uncharacterized protein
MTEEKLFRLIAEEMTLKLVQVKNTIEMLDQGNTIPFISRYRKEKTGSLDEDQIRQIQERIIYLRTLTARKETIIKSIEDQGKLTPKLLDKIQKTTKLQELEDLYLPYRPKKRTRATIAKEKGLQPLAQIILAQDLLEGNPLDVATDYVNSEKGIHNAEEALAGANDITAEIFSENAEIRKFIRQYTLKKGVIHASVKVKNPDIVYQDYFDYTEAIFSIPPHRILALNRGEKENCLKVEIDIDVREIYKEMEKIFIVNDKSIFYDQLIEVIKDAYTRLIAPAIYREVRSELSEKADQHAIEVFALNLRKLLLQPPVIGKVIMGIDPGYRTGCKVAVIDQTGKYLEGTTIYPHPPQKKYFEAKSTIRDLLEKYNAEIIAIGNGTASRETELMVAELIKEIGEQRKTVYVLVNEAGASVYSASPLAKKEFPDLDVSMRGNISIARRLQDPLAELVKIDPKSLGVGLYQHDVNQKKLSDALHNVVESCVNLVGVDLNTASAPLLKYVSGLTNKTVNKIIDYRNNIGRFINRDQLKQVEGIGSIAFQQCAGFLRIRGGDNPLEETPIHPESYIATQKLLKKFSVDDIHQGGRLLKRKFEENRIELKAIAHEIECGIPTLLDILNDLEKPGRDPREKMPKPIFKSDVLTMEDLREGMIMQGTVRNVVDFGVFVDIGVKHDGLVHISQMSDKFVKSPYDLVGVGDVVSVKVISLDLERKRIALSMRDLKKN